MLEIVVLLIAASPFITIPWGWNRWFAEDRRWNTPSTLSFAGLLLASLSAFVVIAALVWSGAVGGFPYYGRPLLRMYAAGFLVSLAGFLPGLGGVWRENPLRWHGIACPLGCMGFWLFSAAGE